MMKKYRLPEALYRRWKAQVVPIDARKAQALSRGGNHQGILVEMEAYEPAALSTLKSGDFLVVLDTLTDVGNIGAIVRTAYALGADGLIACGVKQLHFAAIVRSSAGALLDMPLAIVPNIADVLHELGQQGFTRYGASMEGTAIEAVTFPKKRLLVLGSEGAGLSKKAMEKLDELVSIRMKRPFDSLNVSAAAAILLHRMSYAVE